MCRSSAVCIATQYGLGGPGIETRWGRRKFPQPWRLALGPTQPSRQWVPDLSRGWSGRGVALTPKPHLAPRLRKEMIYPSTPFFVACSKVNFTFTAFYYSVFFSAVSNLSSLFFYFLTLFLLKIIPILFLPFLCLRSFILKTCTSLIT